MNSLKKIGLVLAVLPGLLFTSCETDFEVIGEWQDITIVYGMISQADSVHFVKINKAFLGEGDAYNYAVVQDSSEYSNVDAVVEEYDLSGNLTRSWQLQDSVINNREDGVFYGPEATVYYFEANDLKELYEYKLKLNFEGDKQDVSATCVLIENGNYKSSFTNVLQIQGVVLAKVSSSVDGVYPNISPEWITTENAKVYELKVHFSYVEHYTDGSSELKTLIWNRGSQDASSDDGGETMSEEINGEEFYTWIASVVPSPGSNVTKRVIRGVDFILHSADEEYFNYQSINEPSTGLVQVKPEYTNVDNGYGLFAARNKTVIMNQQLSQWSIRELAEGQHTQHLGFCTDDNNYFGQSYHCQ